MEDGCQEKKATSYNESYSVDFFEVEGLTFLFSDQFDDLSGRVFSHVGQSRYRHESLWMRFDDDFDGLLGLDNKLEPETCLSQREAVGDHLAEGEALASNQFNGPFNIIRTAPVGG
jgi:hypothetical protein